MPCAHLFMRMLCRFWQTGREQLWEEKLGLVERFAGNAATNWGTVSETKALARCADVFARGPFMSPHPAHQRRHVLGYTAPHKSRLDSVCHEVLDAAALQHLLA